MTRPILCALLFTLTGLMACGGGQQPAAGPPPLFKFEIDVQVKEKTTGAGIPGLAVLLDGKSIGYTNREGKFRGLLTEKHNTEIVLGLGKHDDYKRLSNEKYDKVETLTVKYNDDQTGLLAQPIQLHTQLVSGRKDYLVWVSANCDKKLSDKKCSDMPVKVGKQVVGVTDAQGRAHFVHTGSPGDKLEVVIDTTAPDISGDERGLTPPLPSYTLELQDHSTVYAIEESFAALVEEAPKRKTTRRKRRRKSVGSKSRNTGSRKSIVVSSKSKKKEPKKETKKEPKKSSREDPISLFD